MVKTDISIWNRQIKPALVGLSTSLKTKSIFLGIVCPDLTNWYANINSKNGREVYYEYQTDGADTDDGGST